MTVIQQIEAAQQPDLVNSSETGAGNDRLTGTLCRTICSNRPTAQRGGGSGSPILLAFAAESF
jgi:hypothetical protein